MKKTASQKSKSRTGPAPGSLEAPPRNGLEFPRSFWRTDEGFELQTPIEL